MATFEDAKNLFYSKVVFSKAFIIDVPAFVTGRYIELFGLGHFSRHIFFPESFFSELEKKLVEEFGEEAKYALYKAGKLFGWHFAGAMGTPKFKGKHVNRLTKLLFKFMALMYAKSMTDSVDRDKQIVKLDADDLVICPQCGLGLFMPLGSLAGLWAYAYQDRSIEAVQPQCQGRGHPLCKLFAGPVKNLPAKPITFNDFEKTLISKNYVQFNKPTKIEGSSLKTLTNKYLFRYNAGVLEIWGERFFPLEVSFFYLLEQEIEKIGGSKILFDTSFNFFKKLAKKGKVKNPARFATELLCATGWGQVTIIKSEKNEAICEHFPWTGFYSKNDCFLLFSSALSGLLSASDEKKSFRVTKKTILNSLTIHLLED